MGIDSPRIEAAVAELLAAIGEDSARPGISDTPRRVAESYAEFFSGIDQDPLDHLTDAMETGEGELGELVLLRDLDFRSMCEHHLLPFIGVGHIAYIPGSRIVGLGHLARVLETLSSRPQLQERLGEQVADALDEGLSPRGVLVVLDTRQGCVSARGTRQSHSTTVTIASRGVLKEPDLQAAILATISTRGPE